MSSGISLEHFGSLGKMPAFYKIQQNTTNRRSDKVRAFTKKSRRDLVETGAFDLHILENKVKLWKTWKV